MLRPALRFRLPLKPLHLTTRSFSLFPSSTATFFPPAPPSPPPPNPLPLPPRSFSLSPPSPPSHTTRVFDPVRQPNDLHTLTLLNAANNRPLITLWSATWCQTCQVVKP